MKTFYSIYEKYYHVHCQISSRPRLSLIKDGKDDLSVRSLDFTMKNPLKEKEKTTYSCRGFSVIGDCSTKPNKQCTKDLGLCLQKVTGSGGRLPLNPSSRVTTRRPIILTKDQKVDKMIVNMGSEGTKDDVKIKICSEDNSVCCVSDKLSHLLKKEWIKDKVETWESGKFGKCKNQVFKVIFSNTDLNHEKK